LNLREQSRTTPGPIAENAGVKRFRPVYGVFVVLLFGGAVLVADFALDRGFHRDYARIGPDARREVHIPVGDLAKGEVRFYRFLNEGNQEIKLFVGRDETGAVQVAFDANEICFKRKRGYSAAEGGWLVCGACEKSFRLAEVNAGGGGCNPVPVVHRLDGDEVVMAETDVLAGWRLFR
jgi:uncharacterized membrane protein